MRRVKNIPKRPGSEGASGGTFCWSKKPKKEGGRGEKYYQEENKVNDIKMAY